MYGVGASELGVLMVILLYTVIPLAIIVWLIVSVQTIKKSLRNIERSLAKANQQASE